MLVVGLFILTFVVQHFEIPSRSMEQTLLVGDHVFVDRLTPLGKGPLSWLLPYREIHRGDTAVFLTPNPAEQGIYLVKRIIGVPGDRIRLHNGEIYLNGVRQAEPYVVRNGSYDTYRDEFPAAFSYGIGQMAPGVAHHAGSRAFTMARWSSPRTTTLPWAITVTTARTAVTGALCPRKTSSGVRWWFSGHSMCRKKRRSQSRSRTASLRLCIRHRTLFRADPMEPGIPAGALIVTSTRKKIVAVVLVVLALCIFLPPNINGARFSKRLASTLSAALGREVKIGSVKYRLFPRPGFDLYDFKVMDDPAFGAEPLLLCGKVTADLRLTSLWQGRLEIANLKLTDDVAPPSLNLVYAGDHWNLESAVVARGASANSAHG